MAIAQPTLMVFGTAAGAGTPAIWQRVTELVPSGSLALVEAAGHMPWLDDPETVAAEVRRFLGRATPTLADAAL